VARTSLIVPDALLEWARAEAARRGVSLAEIVREALEEKRRVLEAARDPWFTLHEPYRGPGPRDLSERHDDHLAELLGEEHDA
jgi:hypothetical protein